MALFSLGSLFQSGTVPWPWVGGSAIATFTLFSFGFWVAETRFQSAQREYLSAVAATGVVICVLALVVTIMLTQGTVTLDGVFLGSLAGLTLALICRELSRSDRELGDTPVSD
jgi:hypothetical protein